MNNAAITTVLPEQQVHRDDFPVLTRLLDGNRINYLDNAATTLKPKSVIAAIVKYYEEISANIHRGKHFLSEQASTGFEEGRYKIAQYMGCAGNEIIFVKNCTEALNLIAIGLKLAPDDLVVGTLDAHHSNFLPWSSRCRVSLTKTDNYGQVDLNHYEELLRLRPKVVALTHCSNVTGLYIPLEQMAAMARQAGALVVVDAAQSAPHRRLKLNTSNIDFIACSAHKMLGPTGIGLLCGRQELLSKLEPMLLGGGMVDWVETDHYRTRKLPHLLEAGTPHIDGVFGWAAAIRYLEKIGEEFIYQHDKRMGELMLSEALKRDYIRTIGRGQTFDHAALISISIKGFDNMGEVARMMSDSYGIMCRTGHMCSQPFLRSQSVGEILRASAYLYNTPEDVIQFFQALDDLHSVL
ncbi:MAG: aminotransferase class V-fold PLP-dependent enzyme [Bacteroidota bacterium]